MKEESKKSVTRSVNYIYLLYVDVDRSVCIYRYKYNTYRKHKAKISWGDFCSMWKVLRRIFNEIFVELLFFKIYFVLF